MKSTKKTGYRIVRRAGHQGTRPSVASQAEVAKYVTGCDSSSLSTKTPGTGNQLSNQNIGTKKRLKIREFHNIRIATINVRTLQEDIKLALVVKAAIDLEIDILAIQEVRRTSSGFFVFDDDSLKGWQWIWSGLKRKKEYGVGILMAPQVKLESYKEHLAARIISATLCVKNMRLSVINVYAPTDATESESTKNVFYTALNKTKAELDQNPSFKSITLGDFNASISSKSKDSGSWDSVLGHNNSDRIDTNGNGERLLKWCLRNKMKITNSLFRTKRIHRETWKHAATGKWKRIDYICTSEWIFKMVKSCRVFIGPSARFDTDHRLLVMDIAFPKTKLDLKFQLSREVRPTPKPSMDLQSLRKDPEMQRKLTEYLDNELNAVVSNDMDELNEKITESVRNGLEEICPKIEPLKKKEPWEDEQLQELVKKLNTTAPEDIREVQNRIKNKTKELKNSYYAELADNINSAAMAREVEKEFSMAKNYTAIKKSSKLHISNDKLKDHFKEHFAAPSPELDIPPEIDKPENFPHLQDVRIQVNEEQPTEKEMEDVLKSFKNNKSHGTDKLKTEGLKYNSSKKLVEVLLMLFTLIWSCVNIPISWLHANIICLHKKGPLKIAKNYRGLSIGTNMSRILAKIIMERLKEAYETNISDTQFGFRRNRSTTDAILVLKTVIDKYNDTLIAVYIDLTAAYDHIPRNFLFKVLDLRIGASHLIAILYKMYQGTTASILGMKEKFDVLVGCRQGGQESPCIFNYYFDYVLKVAACEIDKQFPEGWGIEFEFRIPHLCTNREQRRSGKLNGVQIIQWLLYADDLVLFCKSVAEAEAIMNILHETCCRFGLTISFLKTKTQVFNNEELANMPSLFKINGEVIENVSEFTYLGQVFSNIDRDKFTELRVSKAVGKFNEMRQVLTDNKVRMVTRIKLMEACVRSRLTYGTQAWYINEECMRKLESCWMELLRQMVKGGWSRLPTPEHAEETVYKLRYTNIEILHITRTENLRSVIRNQYLKYIGHVCRCSNTMLTKKILFAIPKRKNHRDPWINISKMLNVSIEQAKRTTQLKAGFAALIDRRSNDATPWQQEC